MIDWERVRELKEEIGEDDFAEVAEMFMNEVEEVIGRLQNEPNPADYEADLHFLKSSALNLGFARLASLCQEGEHRSASGDAGRVELAPIFACYAASKAAFIRA
ncbi:Hpt domain-containing protein [Maritimibacter sp. HL-12]|uniref:Hpt domain-containing protein n=1 Tax=Maritimibacter sp. HL-12 TaxID=1162418 RepID=UPI000A0F2D53|nr:Hpt domain-containing protein [Maritimibacter sp. HL-12]SMH44839.1 Hpt domain-containing protein [Maritimibacter sp. HL-12]